MPFAIRPVTETDLKTAADVIYAAFDATSPISPIMYPNGYTATAKADYDKSLTEDLNNPNTTCLQVVDTEKNDRMVSFISWTIYKHDQPESEWDKEFTAPVQNGEHVNSDINEDFRQGIMFAGHAAAKRRYIKGRARLYITLVVTHPDYHRRGAAKLMLDKAAELADTLGLPTILTASAFGVPLYARQGYIPIPGAVINMDLRPWGRDMDYKNIMMERPVKK